MVPRKRTPRCSTPIKLIVVSLVVPVITILLFEIDQFTLTIPIELDYAAANADSITIEGLLLLGGNESDPSYVVQVVVKSDTTKN